MAKRTSRDTDLAILRQLPADAVADLRQLAKSRSTDLRWYYDVGVALQRAVPSGRRNAIKTIARGVFRKAELEPTLYACRTFARAIPQRGLGQLDGLNWAIVHYLIYAAEERRPAVIRAIQKIRKSKAKSGETLTPAEARLIVQEICGKESVRRPKRSRIPTLGPKSALRETARLCEELQRFCGTWLQVVARNARKLARDPEGPLLRAEAAQAMRQLQRFLREQLPGLGAGGGRSR